MSDDGEEKKQPILLVEDDWVTRSAIVTVLEALGYYNVIATGSGTHAIKVMDENPGGYPIAILDIFLIDMTAIDLASRFPQDHGIQKLLIISGGTAEDLAAARSAFEKRGISEIHTQKKPVTQEILRRFLD